MIGRVIEHDGQLDIAPRSESRACRTAPSCIVRVFLTVVPVSSGIQAGTRGSARRLPYRLSYGAQPEFIEDPSTIELPSSLALRSNANRAASRPCGTDAELERPPVQEASRRRARCAPHSRCKDPCAQVGSFFAVIASVLGKGMRSD